MTRGLAQDLHECSAVQGRITVSTLFQAGASFCLARNSENLDLHQLNLSRVLSAMKTACEFFGSSLKPVVSTRLTGMELEMGLPATVVWTAPCDRPSSEVSCDAAVLASLNAEAAPLGRLMVSFCHSGETPSRFESTAKTLSASLEGLKIRLSCICMVGYGWSRFHDQLTGQFKSLALQCKAFPHLLADSPTSWLAQEAGQGHALFVTLFFLPSSLPPSLSPLPSLRSIPSLSRPSSDCCWTKA